MSHQISQLFSHNNSNKQNSEQLEIVIQFMEGNSFYSKFFKEQNIQKIIKMTFYYKIQSNSTINLEGDKRPQAIILLRGTIEIYKKIVKSRKKNKTDNQLHFEYILCDTLASQYSTIVMFSDCYVRCIAQQSSEILFVPCSLYNVYLQNEAKILLDKVKTCLNRAFKNASKFQIAEIAESGCIFKELVIYNSIYKVMDVPEYVYFLLEGHIKLETPYDTIRNLMGVIVLCPEIIFGDKDIKEKTRVQNAICCSAYVKFLMIPKKAFVNFMKDNYILSFPKDISSHFLMKNKGKSMDKRQNSQTKLPKISQDYINSTIDKESQLEQKLVKNCRIMLSIPGSTARKRPLLFGKSNLKDYSRDPFEEKVKLYQRIRAKSKQGNLSSRLI